MTKRQRRVMWRKLSRYLARGVFFVIVGILAVIFALSMLITAPVFWLGHELLKDEARGEDA